MTAPRLPLAAGGRLLTAAAASLAGRGLQRRQRGLGTGAHGPGERRRQQSWSRGSVVPPMWSLRGPGTEPVLPVLAGGLLSTEPPERALSPSLGPLCYASTSFLSILFGFLFHHLLYISYRLLPSGYLEEIIFSFFFWSHHVAYRIPD